MIGGSALDKTGITLPKETIDISKTRDAIIVGAIGRHNYIDQYGMDQSRLRIHKLYSSLRLTTSIVPLDHVSYVTSHSAIKDKYSKNIKAKLVIDANPIFKTDKVYEKIITQDMQAYDSITTTTNQISRICMLAYDLAKSNNTNLTLVDLSDSSMSKLLWKKTVKKVGSYYPAVPIDSMLIDDFIQQIICNPQLFGVIVAYSLVGKLISTIVMLIHQ